ncbi:hypothetical protein GCM10010423_24970 [Streptomyces levis]|uniref:Uncharacterized protein n=1 Tax=Streptomyces levis TaxID=285566 RepID=A0ABN3NP01_9ACTN
MPVVFDQGLEVGERLFQGALGEVPEHGGGQGAFVLWRQRHVGTGHGNGSWHAQLPVFPMPVGTPGVTPAHRVDFTA